MTLGQRFAKNPVAWLLGAALVFSVYSHWQTGGKFTRACELAQGVIEIPASNVDIDFDDLEGFVRDLMLEQERLSFEDSLQAKLWLWQHNDGAELNKICAGRLSGDSDYDE